MITKLMTFQMELTKPKVKDLLLVHSDHNLCLDSHSTIRKNNFLSYLNTSEQFLLSIHLLTKIQSKSS